MLDADSGVGERGPGGLALVPRTSSCRWAGMYRGDREAEELLLQFESEMDEGRVFDGKKEEEDDDDDSEMLWWW